MAILGGGVTGLETLLALDALAGDRVDVSLLDPDPEFVYKPLLVEEPFGLGPAERHELAPIADELGARYIRQSATSVDSDSHTVHVDDGSSLDYEALVVCTGAVQQPAFSDAIGFPSPTGPFDVDDLLAKASGRPMAIAFVVPFGVTWPLPLYEVALMTERRARERAKASVQCTVITPESSPLIMFGQTAGDALSKLLAARGIELAASTHVRESASGELTLWPGDRELRADAVVALPLLAGTRLEGLPVDEAGFIPIDEHARVKGAEDVYAAGDGTNFPIKQGGLGTQQADAAAEHIARRAGAAVEPAAFHPRLRGTLLTGADSMHLRHDPAGGAGEGVVSGDYLWWPPHKIASRYLSAWLAHELPRSDIEPPREPLEVELALPKEWHEDPLMLDPYSPPAAHWHPQEAPRESRGNSRQRQGH